MKEISIGTIEMGNLLFGHSRGALNIDLRKYGPMFQNFLNEAGFDFYGVPYDETAQNRALTIRTSGGTVEAENDTFIIRPYYWGEDKKIMALTNFVFKPKGIEIR